MLKKKSHTGVVISLIAGSALLLSGGLTQADQVLITEPEFLEISKPEFVTVSDQEPLGVSNPDSLEISKPRNMPAGTFQNGAFVRPERPNPEYDRCAQQEGFEEKRKCALDALNFAVEEEK